jgi:hypothetical protein
MSFKIIEQTGYNLLNENDLPIILKFNEKQEVKIKNLSGIKQQEEMNKKIRLNLLPEPFIGNYQTAKVILLALNPGFRGDKNGEVGEDVWHKDKKFQTLIYDNIKLKNTQYPYYYLNEDSYFKRTPGHIWCNRVFNELKKIGSKNLSEKLCCFQFHGYHSNTYTYLGEKLPSQEKTFDIIKSLLKDRSKEIILMRSKRIWFKAIPELERNQKNLIILRNPRNPTLSKGNMKEGEYERVLKALK